MIQEMRAQIKTKKRTLKDYETVFQRPEVIDQRTGEIAHKCEMCGKQFATRDHLVAHYKRRHLDFYIQEIRPREDEALKTELGEIMADAV